MTNQSLPFESGRFFFLADIAGRSFSLAGAYTPVEFDD
jgi:hypothetical protein